MNEPKEYDSRYDERNITTAADRVATPIENATMELENEQGMLYEALMQLASRLAPVLKHPYSDKLASLTDKPSEDTASHSPYVRQLSSCIRRSSSTREIVNHLLNNVEV